MKLHLFMLFVFNSTFAFAKLGVDTVLLDPAVLDVGSECKQILLKGSVQYKNTLFAVPNVFASPNKITSKSFRISQRPNSNNYNLEIYLNLSFSDDPTNNSPSQSFKLNESCNADQIKYLLNKNVTDDDQKIYNIGPIPLTLIEISINGFKNVGSIGKDFDSNELPDFINYNIPRTATIG